MYLEELLEVAIGLIFCFLVLSLAVMQTQEWIAGIFKWRSENMKTAISQMLQNPDLVKEFYKHPLIQTLSQPKKKGDAKAPDEVLPNPSYIPSDKFALVLFDILKTAGTDRSVIQEKIQSIKVRSRKKDALDILHRLAELAGTPSLPIQTLRAKIKQAQEMVPGIADALKSIEYMLPEDALDELQRAMSLPEQGNKALMHTLNTLLADVSTLVMEGEQKLASAQGKVETWFNDTMERATGWYKRRLQILSFVIGLILAIVMNVDALEIATQLWREPALRKAVVAAAEKVELPKPSENTDENTTDFTGLNQAIDDMEKAFTKLSLPIGWHFIPLGLEDFKPETQHCTLLANEQDEVYGIRNNNQCVRWVDFPQGMGLWSKLFGFMISGASATLGAPFWFDLLKKIVNIRSSGTKPGEINRPSQENPKRVG